MKRLLLAICFLFASFDAMPGDDVTVIVVRHAEKAEDGTQDPDLTSAGRARSDALAEALAGVEISGLVASQFRRTRQTLAPLARRTGIEVTIAPAQSGALDDHIRDVVDSVRDTNGAGAVVVAGHSNTVPMIVERISGHRVAPLDETHYDRLFVLVPGPSGMDLIESRYGSSSGDNPP